MAQWVSPEDELPPEEQVVEIQDSMGTVRQLKRIGNLWFVPSGAMYVYFTPRLWRKA